MPRYKLVNGERIQLTAEEEAQRDQEESDWEASAFDRAIADLRQRRNALLSSTDFYGLSDVTMSDEMKQYRKDLRDITEGLTTEEQAWENGAFDRAIADLRLRRNALLSATDFYALSDVTMSDEMKQYRQDLRDITEGLTTEEQVKAVEFPTKP